MCRACYCVHAWVCESVCVCLFVRLRNIKQLNNTQAEMQNQIQSELNLLASKSFLIWATKAQNE